MLLLYIAGLLAAFWIGFFFAAILANERRAEDLEDMMKRIEDIKKHSGMYPDEENGQRWLTWEDKDNGK